MGKTTRLRILYLLIIPLVFLFLYRLLSLWNRLLPDFEVFYFGALELLRHHNPYTSHLLFTGLGYPIFTLLLYMPLTSIPFPLAQHLFLLLNLLCIPYCIIISLKILKKLTVTHFMAIYFFSLISFPINFTLGMGQSNLLALSVLVTAYFYFTKKRENLCAILLCLAVIIKPVLLLISLFFLLKKCWKIVGLCYGLLFLLFLYTGALFGFPLYGYYVTVLVPHLLQLGGREVYYNQGLTGFIARLTPNLFLRRLIPTTISVLFLLILMCMNKVKAFSDDLFFSSFLVVLLLTDTLSWQHHFVILLFPFITCFFSILQRKNKLILFILLSISYLLVSINIKNPQVLSSFPHSLLLSHTFYGACILFCLILYLQMPHIVSKKNFLTLLYAFFLTGILINYIAILSCRNSVCLR